MHSFKKIVSGLAIFGLLVSGLVIVPPQTAYAINAPSITNPTSNQTFTNYPRRFDVQWNSVPNAVSYSVIVECNLCKDYHYDPIWSEIGNATVNTTSYTFDNLPIDTDYRVRVRANDGSGQNAWSDYRYFRFTTLALATPTITSPTNQNYTSSPTITWSSVSRAARYAVEWDCRTCAGNGTDWSDVHVYENFNTETSTNAAQLAQAGEYRVRVQTIDNQYNRSPWSAYTYFTYNTNGNPPQNPLAAPLITSPQTGDVITLSSVMLTWRAVPEATAYDVELICNDCSQSEANNDPDKIIYRNYNTGNLAQQISLPNLSRHFTLRVRAKNTNLTSSWTTVNFETASASNQATTITSPTNGQVVQSDQKTVTISWASVPNTTDYQLVFDCSTCANYGPLPQNNYFTGITGTSKTLSLPEFKQYSVMVRPRFGSSNFGAIGSWATVNFELRPATSPNNKLSAPFIFYPQANDPISSRSLPLSWRTVPNATTYDIEVACTDCSTNETSDPNGVVYRYYGLMNTTIWSIDLPASNRHYTARIRAAAANYTTSDWSSVNFFVGNASPSTPTILSPSNGQRIQQQSSTITVTWGGVNSGNRSVLFLECNSCSNLGTGWQIANLYIIDPGSTSQTVTLPESNRRYRVRLWTLPSGNSTANWSPYNVFNFVMGQP